MCFAAAAGVSPRRLRPGRSSRVKGSRPAHAVRKGLRGARPEQSQRVVCRRSETYPRWNRPSAKEPQRNGVPVLQATTRESRKCAQYPARFCRKANKTHGENRKPTLKEACSHANGSATCVQRFDDSRNSAIRITYRISLRSSSLREPRYPLLRVVRVFSFLVWLSQMG